LHLIVAADVFRIFSANIQRTLRVKKMRSADFVVSAAIIQWIFSLACVSALRQRSKKVDFFAKSR